jgi:polyhydroxyalkanoate synthesis regulator phasin
MTNGKRLAVGSLAAAVLGVVALGGVVLAQTPSSGPSGASGQGAAANAAGGVRGRIDGFLNQLAQNLNIDRPTLDNALKTTAKQQVDQAVAAGRMTQDQANQIKQRIDSGHAAFGFGGLARRGRGGEQATGARACGSSLRDAVTNALGISAGDLQQARSSGQTIAQIAQAHGKTEQDLRNATETAAKSCLDQQVQAGSMTQDQEQRILQRLQNGGASGQGGWHDGSGQRRHPATGGGAGQ